MKERLIIWAIGAAWAAGMGVLSFVLNMNTDIVNLKNRVTYLEKVSDSCVKNDIYQLDKMLLQEKLKSK